MSVDFISPVPQLTFGGSPPGKKKPLSGSLITDLGDCSPRCLVHYQASGRQQGYNNPYYYNYANKRVGNGLGFHGSLSPVRVNVTYPKTSAVVKFFLPGPNPGRLKV
jgi:hypothetical protein